MGTFLRLCYCFLLMCLLQGCDFSSQVHKDILAAQEHIQAQEYQKAIEHYEGILLKGPTVKIRLKILYQISDMYTIHLGNPKASTHYLKKILDETSDPFWVVKVKEKLGDIYFSYLHDFTEAARQYRTLVGFRPRLEKSDFYEFRLAQIYIELGKMADAIALFEIIRDNPNHSYRVDAYHSLGMIWFQNQKWEQAIAAWSEYLKKEKRVDKIFETKFLMANAYETMEHSDEAYQIYHSLLGKYPNTLVLRNRLKAIYARKLARRR